MAFEPTNEQKLAIYEKGSILVSAAAGSGKTAVLVERVAQILTDKENPVSADKILVVTYTNAAAAELRQRIEKRLNDEFERNPDDRYLQKQRILMNNAKICTIDSFCIDFIKENFEYTDLSPSFKIVDKATLSSFERTTLSELVNEYFNSNDSDFLELLEFLGDDYDDSKLQKCVYQIFDYSRHIPFPDMWLSSVIKCYSDHISGEDTRWFDAAYRSIKEYAEEAVSNIGYAISLLETNEKAYEKYSECYHYLDDLAKRAVFLAEKRDWNELYALMQSISIPPCKKLSSSDKTVQVEESVAYRNLAKKNIEKISDFVYGDLEFIVKETKYILPHIKKLCELVSRFADKLYEKLKNQNLITFYIAEQEVLSVLSDFTDGKIVSSDVAENFLSRYDSILVDEYQDTNSLQDSLFYILSNEGKNLFCVGDMKQCIYKFRGANPLNFLNKKNNATSDYKLREISDTLRIDLGCNFRSRPEVCGYINNIFKKILYFENSDFDYDEHEKLIPMAAYPENEDSKYETHFVDYDAICVSSEIAPKSRIVAEAEVAAEIIEDTVNKAPFLRDGEKLRKATYGDITILVRSMRDKGDTFVKVLKDKGIPVSVSASDVLESDEVKTLLSILRVLDNPSDDVALVTVLTSAVFAFSMAELAEIRTENKYGSFISSVVRASEKSAKAKLFLNTVERLRRKSVILSVSQLIDEIFEETNLLNIFSAVENGDVKRLNLLSVQNVANSFEAEKRQDLKSFIKYFSHLENKDFSLSSDKGDSVTVMTIHKSKGLQFPVCIVANTSNEFNMSDLRDNIIMSENFGFALTYFDKNQSKCDKTLLRTILKCDEHKQLLAEELRVFYVALTRAEEKLIVLSTFKDLKREVEKKALSLKTSGSTDKVSHSLFKSNNSYADWILECLLLDGFKDAIKGSNTDEHIFLHTVLRNFERENKVIEKAVSSSQNVERLKKLYSYRYPYAELLSLQSKASVTELVHKSDDKDFRFKGRPAFLQEKGLTSAEKGTAIHKIMQYADFEKCIIDIDLELERLYEYMFLTDEEFKVADRELLMRFFNSSLCKRILKSDFVKREMKFLTEFPANQLNSSLDEIFANEMIVVQGAVDLVFKEKDGLVIVDFKTDRNKNENELVEAYSEQLKIYAKACAKILKAPVKELMVYSFSLGREILIK